MHRLQYLLLLIVSTRGRFLAIQTALTAGLLAFLVAYKLCGVSGELSFATAAWLGCLSGWTVDHIAALVLNKSLTRIQTALPGVKETGGALPDGKTVRTIRHMVAASHGPVPPPPAWIIPRPVFDGVAEPTLEELHKMRGNLLTMVTHNPGLLEHLREALKCVPPDALKDSPGKNIRQP